MLRGLVHALLSLQPLESCVFFDTIQMGPADLTRSLATTAGKTTFAVGAKMLPVSISSEKCLLSGPNSLLSCCSLRRNDCKASSSSFNHVASRKDASSSSCRKYSRSSDSSPRIGARIAFPVAIYSSTFIAFLDIMT